jgi:hypothetical protein
MNDANDKPKSTRKKKGWDFKLYTVFAIYFFLVSLILVIATIILYNSAILYQSNLFVFNTFAPG